MKRKLLMRIFQQLCLAVASVILFSHQAFAWTETVPAEKWVPTAQTFKLVGVGNRQFMPYMTGDATRMWAFSSDQSQKLLRFEVRKGDVNPYDMSVAGMTKERSEIGTVQRFPEGTPIHISYNVTIDPGAGAESWWGTVIGQMHQDGAKASPPMAFHLDKNNTLAIALTDGRSPASKTNIATLVRGQDYKMDLFMKGGSQGEVVVLLDGRKVFAFSGVVGQGLGDFYWKLGVYRAASTPTIVVSYRDLKIETGDIVKMGMIDKLPAPLIRVNRVGFITDVAGNKVPFNIPAFLYDNGRLIAEGTGSMYKSINFKVSLAEGIHELNIKYKDSASSETAVVAVGKAQDILNQFDRLTNVKNIGGVFLTDRKFIEIPANTDLTAFVAKNRVVINAITGGVEFVKYAGINKSRADFYDMNGTKLRTEKR